MTAAMVHLNQLKLMRRNAMKVSHFGGAEECRTIEELKTVLTRESCQKQ